MGPLVTSVIFFEPECQYGKAYFDLLPSWKERETVVLEVAGSIVAGERIIFSPLFLSFVSFIILSPSLQLRGRALCRLRRCEKRLRGSPRSLLKKLRFGHMLKDCEMRSGTDFNL